MDKSKLFFASCMSLVVTAMAFGLRAGMLSTWGNEFALSNEQLGWISATAFYGFTLAMLFGGPLCDLIGMKRIIYIAFLGHLIGTILTIFSTGFWPLYISTLFIGIGNGMVEAACNPLVATIYPDEKTKMLNRFHVWFPGGIVIGGLLGYFMGAAGLSWQIQIGTMIIPTLIYGFLFFKQTFPVTERVTSGVSTTEMFKKSMGGIIVIVVVLAVYCLFIGSIINKETALLIFALLAVAATLQLAFLKNLFVFMVFCMLITASAELGTNQLIDTFLKGTGVSPLLILVYISGLMMLGRTFAGNFVHAISPAGMLLFSAVFSTIGLIWLSYASGISTFAAATVFAVGICFFWPTMLGFVAEYLPETGALGLSIMGGAGMLSVSLVLPVLGRFLDNQSGEVTLRYFAVLPAFLVFAFAGLFLYSRKLKHL